MYTLEEIDKQLIQSDSNHLPENFIAAAVKIQEGKAYHSGLIIGVNQKYFLFHYTSAIIDLNNVPKGKWYFHKELSFISSDEVTAFLAHCRIIKQNANPEYGYFYSGSYYDENGIYYSENDTPEYMTCVGFCINVVLGFLENDQYFSYNDWTEESLEDSEEYFNQFITEEKLVNPNINPDQFKSSLRRINPSEYLASAYLPGTSIPIRKQKIDEILDNVKQVIQSKKID